MCQRGLPLVVSLPICNPGPFSFMFATLNKKAFLQPNDNIGATNLQRSSKNVGPALTIWEITDTMRHPTRDMMGNSKPLEKFPWPVKSQTLSGRFWWNFNQKILADDATLGMFFLEHLFKNHKISFHPKSQGKLHQRKQCTHTHHSWTQLQSWMNSKTNQPFLPLCHTSCVKNSHHLLFVQKQNIHTFHSRWTINSCLFHKLCVTDFPSTLLPNLSESVEELFAIVWSLRHTNHNCLIA